MRRFSEAVSSLRDFDGRLAVAQLIVNGVCRVRNRYIHGEKFTGGPDGQWDRDGHLVEEAHDVLRAAVAVATGSDLLKPNEPVEH